MKKQNMKLDFLKNSKGYISRLLMWVSVFLCVLILVKVVGCLTASVKAGVIVKKIVAQSNLDPNEMDKYFDKSRKLADELKKNNLFAPPPPKQHPVKEVSGILGREVLINGKWYKAGDKVGDATIVAIEPTQVKIEWEGNEKFFAPIGAASKPEQKKKGKKPKPKKKNTEEVTADEPAEEQVAAAPAEDDPLAWMGVELSAKVRAKIMEKWDKLSDEEKDKFKTWWNGLSDDQKRNMVASWEEHF